MLLQHNDFREVLGAGGERFERLMHDLVRAEARRLGLADNDIHWDQRTNSPDGGCDIWVTKGHSGTSSFLPDKPTSISLKSGEDGINPATFEREVRSHQTIIKRLQQGNAFLWCCPRPISQGLREQFVAKAKSLATNHQCQETQFSFFWIDAISARVERSPHLIAEHLPTVWNRLDGLSLVKNWTPNARELVHSVPTWVEFGGRDSVKSAIRDHLLGSATNRMLHVAGLSGSGKTRTVVEACREEKSLGEVVYCPKMPDRLLDHLKAQDGSALLIIDEVPLDDYHILARRVEELPETVRVVSIGPARVHEAQREGILILAPPATTDDVAAVARAAGAALGEDVIQSIARFAGKDLRLALLLVEATRKTQAPHFVPLRDNRDVWTRIRTLFTSVIKCPEFDYRYGLLTTTIDIGVGGRSRDELAYIATHYGETVGTMEACVRDAVYTGLGSRPFDHFEATPRALAHWMFYDQAWPLLKNRVEQFLTDCPSDRLRKKFLERCQELPEPHRREVMIEVRDFFMKYFGKPNLSRLGASTGSKLFQVWAETDPDCGLDWLDRATQACGPEMLASFNGENDCAGGWNGRRQVVWLCEHLSCFREYFYKSESILFRLSHVETESGISNNGTNIWKSLFHPWMSFTEVAFDDRLALLMERLHSSAGRSLELVVAAVVAMLSDGGIRAVPPAVVGGRVRPSEWKPETRTELLNCIQKGGREFFSAAARLEMARQRCILDLIIPHVGRFFDQGLFEEFRKWITALGPAEENLRKMRKEVDSWLSWRRDRMAGRDQLSAYVEMIQQWHESLEPRSVIDRVKDLTLREHWEHVRLSGRVSANTSHEDAAREADQLYRSVAEEVLNDCHTMSDLSEWFASGHAKSGDALAHAIARLDSEGVTHAIVGQWIAAGTALSTCAGYLRGLGEVKRRVEAIDAALERLASTRPGDALRITANGDFSDRGFNRIIRCLKECKAEDIWALRPLATYSWRDLLTDERALQLAEELRRLQQVEGYRDSVSVVAVSILHLICSRGPVCEPRLSAVIVGILADASAALDRYSWDWVQLAKAVQPTDPKTICRLAMFRLIQSRSGLDESLNEFVNECARSQPEEAMAAIGDALSHRESRGIFRALIFRGLFDSIGVQTVSRYLEVHPANAPFIARHVEGPWIDEAGNLQVPELADWLMSRFAEDVEVWNEFMMGRHSLEVMDVPEGFEAAKAVATRFLESPKAWVRKWACAEITDMDREIKVHQQMEDHFERE